MRAPVIRKWYGEDVEVGGKGRRFKKVPTRTQVRSAEVQDGRHVAQRPAFQLKFIWIAGKGANMVSCSQLRHM